MKILEGKFYKRDIPIQRKRSYVLTTTFLGENIAVCCEKDKDDKSTLSKIKKELLIGMEEYIASYKYRNGYNSLGRFKRWIFNKLFKKHFDGGNKSEN